VAVEESALLLACVSGLSFLERKGKCSGPGGQAVAESLMKLEKTQSCARIEKNLKEIRHESGSSAHFLRL
jgi:hypothetical protein